jgi:hypothetical protein
MGKNRSSEGVVAKDRLPYSVLRRRSNSIEQVVSDGPRPVLRMEQVPSSCTESDELVFLLLLCVW